MPFSARDARPDDYAHFVRFFAELRVPDPVPTLERFVHDIAPRAIFLEDAGAPVAYAWFYPLGAVGRVVHIVVGADARRRGVGGALMDEVGRRLHAAGCSRWSLNVKTDNLAAIRLYERKGLSVQHESWTMQLLWEAVKRLPHAPHGISVTGIANAGSEDARIETAFRFGEGRLALLRSTEGRVLVRIASAAQPDDVTLGAAVFDPAFPGTSPFAVRTPELARPLLLGLRPHARPAQDHLFLHVEGDPALAKVLETAGATVHFALYRMEGSFSTMEGPHRT